MSGTSDFISNNKAMMKMITDGMYPFEFELLDNKFSGSVLNEDEILEIVRATNGYDAMSKFPLMKKETLARAIKKVNGDALPSIADCANFLGKLPDIIVDMMYLEYERFKKIRDLKIEQIMIDLKNSSRSQTQEGTGVGQKTSDLSGSETSTQSDPK